MKLVDAIVEIWDQAPGYRGLIRQIEKIGRLCYESKMSDDLDGAEKFVNFLKSAEHFKALEHGTVYLRAYFNNGMVDKYKDNKYSKVIIPDSKYDPFAYITTNYRVLVENDWLDDLSYQLPEPDKKHELRVCAHFTCDRGVSAEANRHTVNSAMERSTRYCNFSKGKYGNEIGIILPDEYDRSKIITRSFDELCAEDKTGWGVLDWWFFANLSCETSYMNLLRLGQTPQQARRVLPLDLQTELCHTAFVSDWEHFFKLRSDKAHAHPDMWLVSSMLEDQFKKRGFIK